MADPAEAPRSVFDDDPQTTAADVFIQWKGTDVCLDFHCFKCMTCAHFDGDFAYYLKCPICGQIYEMPSVVGLKPVESVEGGCVEVPTDPSPLRDIGWEAPVPKGIAEFHTDRNPK